MSRPGVSAAAVCNPMCSTSMTGPWLRMAARCMALRSSRTLPGQGWASSSRAAAALNRLGESPPSRRRKCSASSSTSPRRSRSGGSHSGTTCRRYHKSSRKRPSLTALGRSRCVATTMRTSTGWTRLAPTGVISRSCNTRRIFACVDSGMSPISSRNKVPPSASRKRPARSLMAPVNAPLT
ncbi:hypothetical protein D3C79_815460 [compost metagenome]